ncbi:copper amine oxidase N-terminal domain-containing protein [Paenibacillus radicis (ex Xue et al. 2023)]|uniref:Copper amine oxidase N-terminal domain-containing protein n=1 Tax=Paenibacillus radicis (ex Xue et al. 2023) TaxID=2972489 RepID=A0ABT1YCD9_9BACL|nr:copper amine oxidase N-terminal domain-containing protein [Paenibacillus radicis (ex Xue et al. 2023)]MCR8630864.1 copper amine oxidase N-terminal domain-containing protein [Paenibacillus radicis (ex Xue et al. 2023)]
MKKYTICFFLVSALLTPTLASASFNDSYDDFSKEYRDWGGIGIYNLVFSSYRPPADHRKKEKLYYGNKSLYFTKEEKLIGVDWLYGFTNVPSVSSILPQRLLDQEPEIIEKWEFPDSLYGDFGIRIADSEDGNIHELAVFGSIDNWQEALVYKYAEVDPDYFTFNRKPGRPIKVRISGKEVLNDFLPYLDRTTSIAMVPLRIISENLGVQVTWDGENQSVILGQNTKKIVLKLDQKEVLVNGKSFVLDAPPSLYLDNTMVPIRFISEHFDCSVEWDQDTYAVNIIPKKVS